MSKKRILPVTPDEIHDNHPLLIPNEVIESFNEVIKRNFKEGVAIVKLEEIVGILVKKSFDRRDIFDKNWLDVEDIYRRVGWFVAFTKPEESDPSQAYFKFRKKRKDE